MVSVLDKIFNWQKDLPDWQSDLIRRILFRENLQTSFNETYKNILIESKFINESSSAIRLQINDFQSLNKTSSKVVLKRIHSLKNINAIKDDEYLDFVPKGLTLIYGENGSGKSGYARLLKVTCNCRDRIKEIHGNIYQPDKIENGAHFDFQWNDQDHSYEWKRGKIPDSKLTEIAVFDSSCARIIVNDRNEVEYVPYGADIFESLGEAFNQLRKLNDAFKQELPKRPTELESISQISPLKETLLFLQTAKSADEVISKVKLSEQEESEYQNLAVVADPIKLEAAKKEFDKKTTLLTRIEFVRSFIDTIQNQFNIESKSTLKTAWKVAKDARAAAVEVAKGFDSLKSLKGIGSETWKALFLAAEKYSKESVYPEIEFPNVGLNAKCVLCHQDLSPDAQGRFVQFSSYLKNSAEVFAAEKKQQFIKLFNIYKENGFETLKGYSDVEQLIVDKFPIWKDKFEQFQIEVESRRKLILSKVMTGDFESVPTTEIINLNEIDSVIANEKETIKATATFLKDGATKDKAARFLTLSVMKITQKHRDYFQSYIAVLSNNKRLEYISSILNTRKVSSFASQIISEVVTEELRERLQKEFNNLFASQLNVELKQAVQQGRTSHYLTLNIPGNTKITPKDVLSEGEQKVVAIASFLAEISSFGHLSGIVFDDPVSSLDHRWKIKIAKRLAEEAKVRQVIVFTHDIGFTMELQKYCTEFSAEITLNSLTKAGKTTGIRETEYPWPMLAISKRIGCIKNECQRLEKIFRVDGELRYRKEIGSFYSLLRSSWERAVEESVFNLAIVCFRNGIETNRLKSVAIPNDDYTAIFDGMTKCSEYITAHDEAAEKASSVPEPSELLQDLENLEKFVTTCNCRNEKLKKERK
jgi:energy-coupling factor transporter ATP-binding protein EcfA2